eukprot:872992-Alexandrium_andersonii.AAC.1
MNPSLALCRRARFGRCWPSCARCSMPGYCPWDPIWAVTTGKLGVRKRAWIDDSRGPEAWSARSSSCKPLAVQ